MVNSEVHHAGIAILDISKIPSIVIELLPALEARGLGRSER